MAATETPEQQPAARPGRGRRALRVLSTLLIVAGVLLLADGALTLLWKEPLTSLYAARQQHELSDQLERIEQAGPTPVERRALQRLPDTGRRLRFAARADERRTGTGDPVGRLRAPAIGLSTVVVQGTDTDSLRRGPGHYPATPLPGLPGTVAIAGHRTTYGAPFRHIDGLDPGDRIELNMPYGRFTYAVERTRIVPPTATWVTHRVGYDRLVLTACHPLYSAAQRIVVFARLERTEPSFGS
jgi:sortase A